MLLFDENPARVLLSSSLFEVEVLRMQGSKLTDFLARILSGHNIRKLVKCLSSLMKNGLPFLEFGLPAVPPKRDIHRFIDPFSSCHYVPPGAANRQAPPSFLPRSFIEIRNLTPKEDGGDAVSR